MPLELVDLKFPFGYGTYGAGGAYGHPIDADKLYEIIFAAYQQGVSLIDTAPVYGQQFGESEQHVGIVLKRLFDERVCTRDNLFIATKCGIRITARGYEVVNNYEEITTSCDDSLRRLQIDSIDLFFLHRHDPEASVEELARAMSDLLDQKKIRYVGLSEVHETTIRNFYEAMKKLGKEKYFVAIQSEYSLVNHFVADALLPTCKELGLQFFAYSPFAKGFLTDQTLAHPSSIFNNPVLSSFTPQFLSEHQENNLLLLTHLKSIADQAQCTVAQLSLAWLMQQPGVIPLVSTSHVEHLLENIQAKDVQLSHAAIDQIAQLPKISGSRCGKMIRDLAPEMRPYSPSFRLESPQ
jgi:aryl-alcohol dehydrogenase-like predicted oxidoreductase